MYKVVEFDDVYRVDLLNKYGAKEYFYHEDSCNTTSITDLKEFKTEKEAVAFAKSEFEKLSQNELYSVSGNSLYLHRIEVVSFESEDDGDNVQTFGLTLEEYEQLKKLKNKKRQSNLPLFLFIILIYHITDFAVRSDFNFIPCITVSYCYRFL